MKNNLSAHKIRKAFRQIKKVLQNDKDIRMKCNLKAGVKDSIKWSGIVVTKRIKINFTGCHDFNASISVYPLGNGKYCLDNSNVPKNISKRFNFDVTFLGGLTDTLTNLSGSDKYRENENVFMTIAKDTNEVAKKLQEYFQFAKEEMLTANILSNNKYQQGASWTRDMQSYGAYLGSEEYSSASQMLSASTANSFSEPLNKEEKENKDYYNSLYAAKSNELKYKVSGLAIKSSHNSSFSMDYYSKCADLGNYKSDFDSLLKSNPNKSKFLSNSASMHNKMKSYESIYQSNNKSAQESINTKQSSLGSKISNYERTTLNSMESSAKSANHK